MLIMVVQKSGENHIRFCNWKTASGQVEQENQKLAKRIYIRIDRF